MLEFLKGLSPQDIVDLVMLCLALGFIGDTVWLAVRVFASAEMRCKVFHRTDWRPDQDWSGTPEYLLGARKVCKRCGLAWWITRREA